MSRQRSRTSRSGKISWAHGIGTWVKRCPPHGERYWRKTDQHPAAAAKDSGALGKDRGRIRKMLDHIEQQDDIEPAFNEAETRAALRGIQNPVRT